MALMAVPTACRMIRETIFENRFMHVPELMPHGRRRPRRRRHRRSCAAWSAERRAGDGDRSARLASAWCWPGWRRKARRSSTASIISIAASSGWRKSSRRGRRDRAAILHDAWNSLAAAEDRGSRNHFGAVAGRGRAQVKDFVWLPKSRRFARVQPLQMGNGRERKRGRATICGCARVSFRRRAAVSNPPDQARRADAVLSLLAIRLRRRLPTIPPADRIVFAGGGAIRSTSNASMRGSTDVRANGRRSAGPSRDET
jgi:hypothetical protein